MRPWISLAVLTFTAAALPAEDGVPDAKELFQQLDRNKDGKLVASEIPEQQSRFFDRLLRIADKDKDGELSQDEFTQAHKEEDGPGLPLNGLGGQGPRGGNPQQMFARFDRNKDGKVTKDELPEPVRERLAPLFERVGKDELTLDDFRNAGGLLGSNRASPEQMFQQFDTNGDGKLTADDSPQGPAKPMLYRLRELMGKGADDEITKDEFQTYIQKQRDRFGAPGTPGGFGREIFGREPRSPVFMQKLDANGDGRLSKDELAKAADMFDELDANHDGELDPQELMGPPMGRGFAGMDRNSPQPGGGRSALGGQFIDRVFAQGDKNGDGKLSEDELPPRMQSQFSRLDRDGDGFVSKEEFQAASRERFGYRPNGQPGGSETPDGNRRPRRPPAE